MNIKESIIENRVNKMMDISSKIKEFVQEKAHQNSSPFREEIAQSPHVKESSRVRAKRSLTDWRQLYRKN